MALFDKVNETSHFVNDKNFLTKVRLPDLANNDIRNITNFDFKISNQ